MPTEIVFSIMSDDGQVIQPFLEAFESETGIRVRLKVMDWDAAWNQLVHAAIYSDGPDISEIGSTWTFNLVGMNVLRAFTPKEINSMDFPQAVVPAAWKNAVSFGDQSWSIPWAAGSRLVFYRPHLFEQAGIDANTAFGSPDAMNETVRCLHKSGVRVPLAITTGGTHATLHNLSSWIWAKGGDFVHPDGKTLAILDPDALEGMRAYFSLGRYLAPEVSLRGAEAPEDYFSRRTDAAMTISGTWLLTQLSSQPPSGPGEAFRVAQMPGPSFIGGSNLVIWKYSQHAEAAVQLSQFLTRASVQARLNALIGLLPVRIDALNAAPYSTETSWKMAASGLLGGRTFPSIRLWGVIEDRLSAGMDVVWSTVLDQPEADPKGTLVNVLTPLCQRLNIMLHDQ